MDERDLMRFEFEMIFGRIYYIVQHPWYWKRTISGGIGQMFWFKRFIQSNDTYWHVTPYLQLCEVHVCYSNAIESTAPTAQLNFYQITNFGSFDTHCNRLFDIKLAENLYFSKMWFNFE